MLLLPSFCSKIGPFILCYQQNDASFCCCPICVGMSISILAESTSPLFSPCLQPLSFPYTSGGRIVSAPSSCITTNTRVSVISISTRQNAALMALGGSAVFLSLQDGAWGQLFCRRKWYLSTRALLHFCTLHPQHPSRVPSAAVYPV